MALEGYALQCPKCGRVAGYLSSEVDADEPLEMDADKVMERAEFETASGPVTRFRCPCCGT